MAISARDLRQRGLLLEYATIAWNLLEAVVAAWAGLAVASSALVGFGLDSLIEVFAATVVVWDLRGEDEEWQAKARSWGRGGEAPIGRRPGRGVLGAPGVPWLVNI